MADGRTGRRRLYLMRHGHVDYFAPGLTDFSSVPLTEEGARQADSAGAALATTPLDLVFTSGLRRTEETAARVISAHADDLSTPTRLPAFEELKGGKIIVPTREELAARLAFSFDAATEPGATFLPDGEPFADAFARVREGLEDVVRNYTWRTALLVAHEGINRIILSHACGAGLGGLAHFEQDLACVNVLDLDVVPNEGGQLAVERFIIKAVNLTTYDPVKLGLRRTSLEHLFGIDFGGARPRASEGA